MIQPTPSHFTVLESAMMGPIYHLLVGICVNGYPLANTGCFLNSVFYDLALMQ